MKRDHKFIKNNDVFCKTMKTKISYLHIISQMLSTKNMEKIIKNKKKMDVQLKFQTMTSKY